MEGLVWAILGICVVGAVSVFAIKRAGRLTRGGYRSEKSMHGHAQGNAAPQDGSAGGDGGGW